MRSPDSRDPVDLPGPLSRFRLRLTAACALLVGLALIQSPGLMVADTKLDLPVEPGRFLLRAVHLWDPLGAFGQLQNQAYGYLWPMGPFFLGGTEAGLPEWVVQRLWLALVMCVALVGAAKLARELGVRSDLACLVAGFAYALSPRMLSTMGQISIEAWPSSLAPWVLLPLVIGSRRGSPRRAAAWAALAVAMVGGVNAAATFAVIPMGVVWLLTRGRGSRRTSMMLWWPIFTIVATIWWLVPLFVLGSYSPPFLDFIESAANTTFPTTLYDSLRGTSNWVVYLGIRSRAGNDLLTDPILILNSAVLMVLGLIGILHRRNPERLFLVLSLLLGMFMVTMGHLGSVQGWFAADLNAALDGVLAPLRNVHKFDPVIRLPLVLGLAWTVDLLVRQLRSASAQPADRMNAALHRFNTLAVLVTAAVAVFGAAIPAATGRITPTGGFASVPGYWSEASDWLHERDSTALMLPGSSFGDYVWGFPQDEPIQPLGQSPWAVRNAVPLTPPGNIRMLDAIEERLSQGHGSPALATYLHRAGVTHLVVRNDIVRTTDIPDPVLVHQALAQSPGIVPVQSFGPAIGGEGMIESADGSRILINGGWQSEYSAIEIYSVAGSGEQAVTSQVAPVVVGGSEDLLSLSEAGVLGVEPTRLGVDVPTDVDPDAPVVLTDGMRAVERHFGRLHDGQSATLAPDDPRRLANPTRDYLPEGADPWVTWARYDGIAGVTASSSMSDANSLGVVQRGRLPFAAFDSSPETYWQASEVGSDSWWEVTLDRPTEVTEVRVTAGPDEQEVLRVRAGDQTTEPGTISPGSTRTFRLDGSEIDSIRVEDASGRTGRQVAIAEVRVPGVTATRSLVLPTLPEAWGSPERIVLRAVSDARTGCATVETSVRCVAGREVAPEEPMGFRRVVTLPEAARYDDLELRVRGRAGSELQALLDRDQLATATATSSGNPDLRSSALAAIDGDPGTTWTAALSDVHPELRLGWFGPQRVTGLDLRLLPEVAARLPNRLVVSWPGGSETVDVEEDGSVRLPAIRTDQLTIAVEEADPAVDLDFDQAASSVPVGITEIRVRGVEMIPRPVDDDLVETPCGSGPALSIAGQTFPTRVVATERQLYVGATVDAEICGDTVVDLPEGESVVDVGGSRLFTPESLVLSDGTTWRSAATATAVEDDSAVDVGVVPAPDGTLLTVRNNANRGWVATQDGTTLEPVLVDGWQQGWLLAGEAPVEATFEADRVYRAGLIGGAVALLALLVLTLLRWRPWRDTAAPELSPARYPLLVVGGISLLAAGLYAGWPGLVLGAIAFAGGVVSFRRAPVVTAALVVTAMVPAVSAYLLRPWGSADGWAGDLAWPHYFVLIALCLVAGGVGGRLDEPERRSRRFFKRIAGSSTTR